MKHRIIDSCEVEVDAVLGGVEVEVLRSGKDWRCHDPRQLNRTVNLVLDRETNSGTDTKAFTGFQSSCKSQRLIVLDLLF